MAKNKFENKEEREKRGGRKFGRRRRAAEVF